MKTYFKNLNAMLLAALALFAFSCDMEDKETMDGNAKVNVYLVDAPADYDEVWVEVLGVDFLMKGENESDESAWVTLGHASDDKKINLLDLVAGNTAHLGEIEVPAGEISQIRLLLGDDNYLMQNGQSIELKTPSAQQSGLKLKVDKPLQAGISYDLTIDFDAAKSIVKAGNSGNYILKPVLRVIAQESATIEGTVLPLEAGPVKVAAIMDIDTLFTFTNDNGFFMLRGLKEGSYNLWLEPNEDYQELIIEDVQTVLGEVTKLDPIELEEAEEEEEEEEEEEGDDEG